MPLVLVDLDNILNDKKYAKKMHKYGVTNQEYLGMQLLSRIEEKGNTYTAQEIKLLTKFIEESLGNMAFNERLYRTSPPDLQENTTGINENVISMMLDLTYKLRNADKIDSIREKADATYQHVINGHKPPADSALSLREFSILHDVASVTKHVDTLNKVEFLKSSIKLQKITENSKTAEKVELYINDQFNKNFSFKSGSITFSDPNKSANILGNSLTFYFKLVSLFVTKYSHVGKGYQSNKKQAMRFHLNPAYQEDKFSFRDYLLNDIYVIKLEKLITKPNEKFLKTLYGDTWLEQINAKYQKIERALHDNQRDKYCQLSADDGAKQRSIGLSSLFSAGLTHRKFNARKLTYKKIQWEKNEPEKPNFMLCSEFAARTTIASIEKLNSDIAADFKNRTGNTKLGNTITLPIKSSENLSAMLPSRFLKVLQKAGCVEKMKEEPEVVKQFMKRS